MATIYEAWEIVSTRASRLFLVATDERRSPEYRARAFELWKAYAAIGSRLSWDMIMNQRGGTVDLPMKEPSRIGMLNKEEYVIPRR